jgi:WD40 repeat protein/tRNA A-37 threonylcarbamoyl transferase component Bud32
LVSTAIASHAADAEEAQTRPAQFGNYELLEPIGRGATGAIWRARQRDLDRIVAVKFLLPATLVDESARARFRREAQAIAALQHPNIVAIHEVGEHAGQPFFSVDYIAGRNLAACLHDGSPSPQQAARWLLALAQAVAHAHGRGVIHRDIKPANILIDEAGVPHLTDFGLVKLLNTAPDLTLTGQALGTASYMAPEQAAGEQADVGKAVDIYALGAVLYHILTGRPPFLADSVAAMLKQVVETEPVPVDKLNPSVPRDLETICLKCLEKSPARRYATAEALASDLQHFLHHEPITARPVSRLERAWRACGRRPLATALGVLLVVSLALGAAGIIRESNKTHAANTRLRLALQAPWFASVASYYESGDAQYALALQGWMARESPDNRANTSRLLSELTSRNFLLPLGVLDHPAEVRLARFSPDNRLAATVCVEHKLRLWDTHRFTLLNSPIALSGPALTVEFSDDGRNLLVADTTSARLLALFPDFSSRGRESAQTLPSTFFTAPITGQVASAQINPDASVLAVSLTNGSSTLWHPRSGRKWTELPRHGPGPAPVLSPDGRVVAVLTEAQTLSVLGVTHGQPICPPLKLPSPASCLGFAADGQRLGIGCGTEVWLWRPGTNAPAVKIAVQEPAARIQFSPDSQLVLISESDRRLTLCETREGRTLKTSARRSYPGGGFTADGLRTVEGANGNQFSVRELLAKTLDSELVNWPAEIRDIALAPDGRRALVVGGVSRLPVWDLSSGRAIHLAAQHEDSVSSAVLSADSTRLLTASADGTARVWDVRRMTPVAPPLRHRQAVTSARFSANGQRVLTASLDGTARVWDARTGQPQGEPLRHPGPVAVAEFSPAEDRLCTVTREGMVRFWKANNGAWVVPSSGGQATPASERVAGFNNSPAEAGTPNLAPASVPAGLSNATSTPGVLRGEFSRDGRRFVFVHAGGWAEVWDAAAMRFLARLPHADTVNAAQFTPNSRHVATASRDRTVQFWDAATGARLPFTLPHPSDVMCLALAGDGRVATGGYDRKPRLWTAGGASHTFRAQRQAITAVAFSADDEVLFALSRGRLVTAWDTRTRVNYLSPLQGHPEERSTTHLALSPDNRWIVTCGRDGTALAQEITLTPGPAPAWLPALAEALGGQRFDGNESYTPVSREELVRLREQLRALPGDDYYARWVRWFFADRGIRPLSPSSQVITRDHARRLARQGTLEAARQALVLSPDDPVVNAALAQRLRDNFQPTLEVPFPETAAAYYDRRAKQLEAANHNENQGEIKQRL